MSTPQQMSALARKIAKLDPAFARAVKTLAPCPFGIEKPKSTNFQSLIRAIIAQQVSSKAAVTIGKRLTDLCGGRITPERVGALSLQEIQSAGLSGAKVRTISEFTTAILNGSVQIKRFTYLNDDEIMAQLLPLFGFGRWTIEMFLIFQLGRMDIWPVDDLAVRRGWDILHANAEPIKPRALMAEGERFAGMRSVVAWYCWRAS
jgi:DNA-3-methyladenine glycosylase II